MKFRKKPVVIEAVQWTGSNLDEVRAFVPEEHRHNKVNEPMGIKTLEGVMTVSDGDWIIKGVKGEFYPCKSDIFEATYGPASMSEFVPIDDGHTRRLIDALETVAFRYAHRANPKLYEAMLCPLVIDAEERELGPTLREALEFAGRSRSRQWLDAFWEADTAVADAKQSAD